jgi:hypothetical protein
MVLGIVPAAVFMLLIFKLRSMGLLYYGDGGNLWESTLRTLTLLIAGTGHPLLRALAILFSAIVFIRFVMLSAAYIKTKKLDINGEFIFSFLFTGNVAAMIAAHYFLGVKYPEDRTAMHLFPLLIGSVLFFFDKISRPAFKKWKYFALLPALLFPAHFIFNVNLTHASWWAGERIPQLFYEKVRAAQAPGECPATIAGYFLQAPQWSYLNYINGGSQNQLYVSGFPSYNADYQIVDVRRNPLWLQHYDVAARDEVSGFDLLKRKKNVNTVPVYSCSDIGAPEPAHEEFLSIFELRTDSLAGMSLKFWYDLSIQAEAKPFRSCIVVSVSDENDHVLIYEKIELDQIKRHWSYDNNMLRHAIITEKIPEGMVHIKTYLWNMDLQTYSAIGTCELFGWASD